MQQCVKRAKEAVCKFIKIAVYSCDEIVYTISVANSGDNLTLYGIMLFAEGV